jgi:predicted PurR-regulated permease PerM
MKSLVGKKHKKIRSSRKAILMKKEIGFLTRAVTILVVSLLFYVIYLLYPFWGPILRIILYASCPFLLGILLAYLLYPLVEWLTSKGLPRVYTIFLLYFLFIGGGLWAVYFIAPSFFKQLEDLSRHISDLMKHYDQFVRAFHKKLAFLPEPMQERIDYRLNRFEKTIAVRTEEGFLNLMEWLSKWFLLILSPIISFYLLKNPERVVSTLMKIVPNHHAPRFVFFLRELHNTFGAYIRGQLLVCVMIGTCSAILFWLFHIPYSLLLGFIVGITNIIPYFGAVIGAVPVVFIASMISIKMMIITVCMMILIQFLEGNLISPYVVGKSVHLHPLWILAAVLVGGEAFGIAGLLFAVPSLVVIKSFATSFIRKKTL